MTGFLISILYSEAEVLFRVSVIFRYKVVKSVPRKQPKVVAPPLDIDSNRFNRGPEVLVLYLERPGAKSWELRSLCKGAPDTALRH